MTKVSITGVNGYDVHIGSGASSRVGEFLVGATKALLIHQPVMSVLATQIREQLAGTVDVLLAEIPDGEDAKRVEVAAFCWGIMGQADFTRTDAVVGLGGGAATDLAGFVAATWLRGVEFVNIPTTVLGAVDASVGGKTGINTSEGKNLVGSFHAPAAVLVDTDILASLPHTEARAGFAEIAKAGFISDPTILDLLEQDVDAALDATTSAGLEVLRRAIQVKATVVSEDFTEQGLREILNYGHTLGHAIEHAERYRWRHGAAISIGMIFAAELSRMTRGLSDSAVDRHRHILGDLLGLPLTYPTGRWETLLATMRRDKKARGAALRFVLLDDIARPTVTTVPDESILFAAYGEIAG
ncbi:MAG: 3-dehydroquinate synthase [Microbacteriaceae bacterium]